MDDQALEGKHLVLVLLQVGRGGGEKTLKLVVKT